MVCIGPPAAHGQNLGSILCDLRATGGLFSPRISQMVLRVELSLSLGLYTRLF